MQDDHTSRRESPAWISTHNSLWNATTLTVAVYVFFGLAWVCTSDLVLYFAGMQPATATLLSMGKGSLFFILTSPILYWRLRSDVLSLSKMNELLRAVTEGTTDSIFVKNRLGKYLLVNPAAARLVEADISEIIGKDDRDIFDSDTAHRVMAIDHQVMETGRPMTTEFHLNYHGVTRVFLVTKAPFFDTTVTSLESSAYRTIFPNARDRRQSSRSENSYWP